MDVMRQVRAPLAVLVVARKQDHHSDHRILKNFDFFIRQTGSGDINYDWSGEDDRLFPWFIPFQSQPSPLLTNPCHL